MKIISELTIDLLKKENIKSTSNFIELFVDYFDELGYSKDFSNEELIKIANDFINMTDKYENRWIPLLYKNNICIGFAVAQVTDFNKDTYLKDENAELSTGFPKWAFLREFYVTKNERKKGYGNLLNEEVIKLVINCDVNEIYLTSDSAIPFWEKVGYKKTDNVAFNDLEILKLYIK